MHNVDREGFDVVFQSVDAPQRASPALWSSKLRTQRRSEREKGKNRIKRTQKLSTRQPTKVKCGAAEGSTKDSGEKLLLGLAPSAGCGDASARVPTELLEVVGEVGVPGVLSARRALVSALVAHIALLPRALLRLPPVGEVVGVERVLVPPEGRRGLHVELPVHSEPLAVGDRALGIGEDEVLDLLVGTQPSHLLPLVEVRLEGGTEGILVPGRERHLDKLLLQRRVPRNVKTDIGGCRVTVEVPVPPGFNGGRRPGGQAQEVAHPGVPGGEFPTGAGVVFGVVARLLVNMHVLLVPLVARRPLPQLNFEGVTEHALEEELFGDLRRLRRLTRPVGPLSVKPVGLPDDPLARDHGVVELLGVGVVAQTRDLPGHCVQEVTLGVVRVRQILPIGIAEVRGLRLCLHGEEVVRPGAGRDGEGLTAPLDYLHVSFEEARALAVPQLQVVQCNVIVVGNLSVTAR
eukprot:Hpha_TRINITY_DN16811_c3_g12::TRINITY_DN16811_c3_g12_i1::g.151306::m.151306